MIIMHHHYYHLVRERIKEALQHITKQFIVTEMFCKSSEDAYVDRDFSRQDRSNCL